MSTATTRARAPTRAGYAHRVPAAEKPARKRGRPPTSADTVEARRQRLIVAAYEVLLDKGYQGSGIADITGRAGFGFSTFYKSFASKREILDAVMDYGVNQLLSEILVDARTQASTGAELESQFRSIGARIYAVCRERPLLARFLVLEATAIDDDLTSRWFGLIELAVSVVRGYLDNGVENGIVRDDLDTAHIARAVLGIIVMGLFAIASGDVEPASTDGYLDTALDLIVTATRATD